MNPWIRFGCFLTGYNPALVSQASEATAKAVKRYTSALLIISILWGLIGYIFAEKYLGLGFEGALVSALVAVVVIIQVERQIILQIRPSGLLKSARLSLALVMSFLGAVITDQILFADDIAIQREREIGSEVAEIVETRSQLLDKELTRLQAGYDSLDVSRKELLEELSANPFVTLVNYTTTVELKETLEYDSVSKAMVKVTRPIKLRTPSTESVQNPKWEIANALQENQNAILAKMDTISERKLNLASQVEAELKSRSGFLTELEALHALLWERPVSFGVWVLFFLFFLALELLVLVSKAGSDETDYEVMVMHQQTIRKRGLADLAKSV